MKMFVGAFAVVALVIASTALWYHGLFSAVTLCESTVGPYEFIYRTSPGGDFGAVRRITTEIEALMRNAGVKNIMPLDIYYPEGGPGTEIGFVVPREALATIAALPNAPLHRTMEPARMITTRLPYRSPFSFIIGAMKVDPALKKYREQKGYAKTWAGTINEGKTILYLQPVAPLTKGKLPNDRIG